MLETRIKSTEYSKMCLWYLGSKSRVVALMQLDQTHSDLSCYYFGKTQICRMTDMRSWNIFKHFLVHFWLNKINSDPISKIALRKAKISKAKRCLQIECTTDIYLRVADKKNRFAWLQNLLSVGLPVVISNLILIICINIHTRTHTHTHIYIFIYLYSYISSHQA